MPRTFMTDATETDRRLVELRSHCADLTDAIEGHFLGHREVVDQLLYCTLAGGHSLLEGAPGLGKTTLVRALSTVLGLDYSRIQFTPDLMPPDVLGTRILEESQDGHRHFSFQPGPIFAHVVLADEINRATPRTQSALLEAMQEGQVTTFGESRKLEPPFFVIATQNPIEMEGTYPLPEAQLDRFMVKVLLTSPDQADLVSILDATTGGHGNPPQPIVNGAKILEMQELVRETPASSDIVELTARLVRCTHPGGPEVPESVRRMVRFGSSPRGGQALLLMSKARALASGRLFVTEEDIEALAAPTLRHRIILSYEGEAARVDPDELVADAFAAARRG
jgi:MoxR-like ATPase